MKKYLVYIAAFLGVLILAILFVNEREDRIHFENESIKWAGIAEREQEVPSVDEKAQSFVKLLNSGEHKAMLTGDALQEYENALLDDSEINENVSEDGLGGDAHSDHEDHEDHSHELEEVDTSLQNVSVLLSSTKSQEDGLNSQVLYQIIYEGFFDNAEVGIVDQRILTILMDIEWEKTGQEYLVGNYNVQLIQDNINDVILGNEEGSEPNEENS